MMDMDPVIIELQPRERPERQADIQPGKEAERTSADCALADSIDALQVFASTLDEGMETTDLADALPDRISQLRHMVDQARGLLQGLIAINREYVDKTVR